jgi:serine/threonine protein kinase
VDVAEVIEKMYPAPKPIKWDSFDVIGKLGKGGFGEVFLAELRENKAKGITEKYAIKRV